MNRGFRQLGLVLALQCVCSSAWAEEAERYRWSEVDAERGVVLYTSDVASHSFEAVKGVVTMPIGAAPLFMTLYDFARYPSWYYRCNQTKVLKSPPAVDRIPLLGNGEFGEIAPGGPWVLFFRQLSPPLDDRWTLLRCTYRAGPSRTLLVEFESMQPASYPEPPDTVRMHVKGAWMLRPLGKSRTEVTFTLDVDPRTSAPAFLVNRALRATVFETLMGLSRAAREVSAASPASSLP